MKRVLLFSLLWLSLLSSASAKAPSSDAIIDRARATVGTEKSLNEVVTLKMLGSLDPVDPEVPAATVLIIARKPQSQRLEIRVDDMVETTILNSRDSCIIRSNLKEGASRMRPLTETEMKRVRHGTLQFFSFFKPDFKNGERVSYEGIVTWRDKRAHKLKYNYPDGLETIRYFSVEDDTLIATVTENNVESVSRGSQVVKGIKYPEFIDYYEKGRKLHTIQWSEIIVNEPLAPGVFEVPKTDEK